MPTTGPSGAFTSLTPPGGLEDLALAVAAQGVRVGLRAAVLLLGLRLGEADGGDLGLAVGDPRDAGLVDRPRAEARDLLGDEDAVLEAAVRELQAGHDVADGVDVVQVGAQPVVGEDEAALHRDAGLLVAVARGVRPAADRDQQGLGVDRLAGLQRHGHARVVLRGAGEPHAGLVLDAALAERALQLLGRALVLERHQPGQRLDDGHLGAEATPHAGELDADHAAAEHDHALGT